MTAIPDRAPGLDPRPAPPAPAGDASGWADRRAWIEEYFDRTAAAAWARLTSTEPVSRIRATVRAGRDEMRGVLASWLPADLTGQRVLDAGCGPGQLSVALAARGARVVAVDVARTLVELAEARLPHDLGGGHIDFACGDMLDPAFGTFDYVVAMDSLIHYRPADQVAALSRLAPRVRRGILFTFPPRTGALAVMHAIGRLFPRGHRAPAVEPVREARLRRLLAGAPALRGWRPGRTHRVARGFYISQALELLAP